MTGMNLLNAQIAQWVSKDVPRTTGCTDTWGYPMGLFVTWPPMLSASNGCLVLPFPLTGSTLVKQFCPLHPWGSWNSLKDINFTSKEVLVFLSTQLFAQFCSTCRRDKVLILDSMFFILVLILHKTWKKSIYRNLFAICLDPWRRWGCCQDLAYFSSSEYLLDNY